MVTAHHKQKTPASQLGDIALKLRFLVQVSALVLLSVSASATETTTYTYDELGRLVTSAAAGGPADGVNTTTGFDPAGNRSSQNIASTATPSFSIGTGSATEGGTATFTVTKSGTASGTLTVNYATASGTATSGSDYTAASGTLTFLAGDTSKTFSVATIDDALVEGTETFTAVLSSPSAGSVISSGTGTGTIADNDFPPPSFAIGTAPSVVEGGALIYTVSKTGTATASFSVNFASANGTAVAGSDYTATSGTLAFLAADTTKTLSVATIDDAVVEVPETVLINLSGATGGATITTSQGTGTINDNDETPPSFAIGNAAAVAEGGILVYTVTKNGTASNNYSVNFASANGTATAPSDYTANSGTLTFTSADTSKTVSVTTIDDTAPEGAETVLVNLSGATGGSSITTAQGTGTINASDQNQPPVANADASSVAVCKLKDVNVTANDTDPEGNLPLTLVSVSSGTLGTASVLNSTTVHYEANDTPGTDVLTYTITDSLGASANGTLTITVTSAVCS
jgi:YD repeat-containing protein